MKATSVLSCVAIVTSLAAIGLQFTAPKQPTEAEIEAAVDAVLAKKEQAFVAKHAPAFKAMFQELQAEGEGKEWEPRTIEELVEPLVKIISEMGKM